MDRPVPRRSHPLYNLLLALLVSGVIGTASPARAGGSPAILRSGVIFVANGAGDFRCATPAIQRAVTAAGLPLRVETVCWSHGHYRVIADQNDQAHVQVQGRCLAAHLIELRRRQPAEAIFLFGHCAGCSVVIAAAEAVPPGTVDRLVCLAPSVRSDYDLRAALRGCRDGMEVYYSKGDWWFLGPCLHCTSLLCGKYYHAAGRCGFDPVVTGPEDAYLYGKLRQYPWQPSLKCTGHDGWHFGGYQKGFLLTFVWPLLIESLSHPSCIP